jgi:hypothetical protein
MRMYRSTVAACAFAAMLAPAGLASAEEMHFTADLSAANVVPPNDSSGTGAADITYDTDSKEMSWTIEYSGLTGPVIAAHFHGPAAAGENAGVEVPIDVSDSPMEGSATLNDSQASDLMGGQLYVNIHTDAHPDGEIRGQVMEEKM